MSPPNWKSQTIFTGDCLDIMRGMNGGSVDLIYLDPPFSKNKTYSAPIGSKAAGAAFKDTWTLQDVNLAWHGEIKHEHPGLYALLQATRQVHSDALMSYLISMSIRIMEMHRLLKPTGTLYLHCDHTASHYLKALMDCIFGHRNFICEISWFIGSRSGAVAKYKPGKSHETILAYAVKYGDHTYNPQYLPYSDKYLEWFKHTDEDGRKYRTRTRRGELLRQYLDESPGNRAEITGYPTQKPVALLQRIIRASSNEGGVVLDPFCGCATSCIAAEMEHRQWAGIDISPKAAELVDSRMRDELGLFYKGAHRADTPLRTDLGRVIPYNSKANKTWLYGEQGGFCNGCETHFQMQNLEVDHIIPRAKGGTDHISNLQLLCGACNSLKGTKSHEELLVLLTNKGWIKEKQAA